VVVPLASRRLERLETMQALVDAVSAFTLGVQARERLDQRGPMAVFGWAELAIALLLVAATVALLGRRRRYGRWISALGGIMLLLEGWSKTYGPKGHPSWALTLNGLALLVLAALAPWIETRRAARRVLRLDGGVTYRLNRFRGFQVARHDVAALSIGEPAALVRTRDGRTLRIDLADLRNREEVEAALRAWATERGVSLAPLATAGG
jgi:hypothetical protein